VGACAQSTKLPRGLHCTFASLLAFFTRKCPLLFGLIGGVAFFLCVRYYAHDNPAAHSELTYQEKSLGQESLLLKNDNSRARSMPVQAS
jgi:hypothetical protein